MKKLVIFTQIGIFCTTFIKIIMLLLVKKFSGGYTIRNVLLKNGQIAITGTDCRGKIVFEIFNGEPINEIDMASKNDYEEIYEEESEEFDEELSQSTHNRR